jgi:SNF2 family DNA or RNA helicase
MALTSIIKLECSVCHKIAVESSRMKIGSTTLIRLACGHITSTQSFTSDDSSYENLLVFNDGGKPRPYQLDAIKFAEDSGFRCIIADEQGVGKTIEALCTIKLHPEKLLPCVLVVPSSVKLQWMYEIHKICGNGPEFLTQVIQSGKEKALPGFKFYIVSYDMLKKEDIFEYVDDIKLIVIDECQRIKNHLSDRAKAVQRVAAKTPHIIPMSGTPIKNNAGEYFTVLNLVAPRLFPHYQRFLETYCDAYETFYSHKVGGLKDAARFHEDTKSLVIRRTKNEVLKDLPSLDRKFYHVELDKKLNKAYANALKELDELLYSEESSFDTAGAKIAIMARMRHITGVSKVTECVDFTTEFLLSTDRKMTIFTEHKDVAELVKANLNKWLSDGGFEPCLHLHSGLDSTKRQELVEQFRDGKNRITIAATKAAGEGLNLQFCSDAIILERQWNPANEEQAEARFHRFGQINSVSITYMIASGTIDEYFTELVEQKRAIVASAMDNKEIKWDQQSLMKELAEMLVSRGREKWTF